MTATTPTTFPVITSLDVDKLATGEHRFNFSATSNALGQDIYLPVRIFKGSKVGKKVVITAGVHGDEQSGIVAALKIANELVGKELAGCVTIISAMNPTGIMRHSRYFYPVDPDAAPANMNRHFPGNAQGNEVERFIDMVWTQLLKPNADIAIDLHTQTSGTVYPLYVFADFRIDTAKLMAELLNPDAILDDPGEPGVLETTWNQAGIPSITVEIGAGRIVDPVLVERSVSGVLNILKHYQILTGVPSVITPCLQGKTIISIKAVQGGWVEPQVTLMQKVKQGELLAIQWDSFGDEVARYLAPEDGTVLSHNVEALRAAGSLVVRLIK